MKGNNILHTVSYEFFRVSLIVYMLLVLVEILQPGVVSTFFNINYLLLFVLITGIISVLSQSNIKEHEKTYSKSKSYKVK
jgi:hypothetical protein